jgi:hypothetical protein
MKYLYLIITVLLLLSCGDKPKEGYWDNWIFYISLKESEYLCKDHTGISYVKASKSYTRRFSIRCGDGFQITIDNDGKEN